MAATKAAAPAAMTPIDMLELPSIGGFDLSPDGHRLAYLRETADWDANRRTSALWVKDLASGRSRQWIYRLEDVRSPRWSADGQWLAFVADEPGGRTNQVYLSRANGGDAFPLTDSPTSVSSVQWAPEGSDCLYYLAADERSEVGRPELKNLIRPFDSREPTQLWRVRVSSGERERITSGPLHVRSFHVSRAGIVIHRSRGALIDDKHSSSSLWLTDLDGANVDRLDGPSHTQGSPRLSPDGSRVLYIADVNAEGEPYYQASLFVLEVGEAETRREVAADEGFEVLDALWAPDGDRVFILANLGAESQVLEVDLASSRIRAITTGEHDVRGWRHEPDTGGFIVQLQTAESPGELWRVSAEADGRDPEPLTDEYARLAKRFRLPGQELVSWPAEDGTTIEGLLTLPTEGFAAPHPLVVQSHGGPHLSDRWGVWRWRNYQPVLAAHGYATLRVNYRGSTGYGDAFHRGMLDDYWRHAHTDVLSGVDHLISIGVADPERLAAMGWSAGGHMTNKLVTFTDRFRAASSGAGAVDWVSMYGESDTRVRRESWLGGAPWEEGAPLEAYRKQSPLFDAWRVKTPTLIFVGEEDRRVPRTQSILFARALSASGVLNRLYVARSQGHGWKPLDQRLFKINAELEWFERHVKGLDYAWQSTPSHE